MLADLKRQRGVVKSALTCAQTFVSKFIIGEQPVSLLEFRQEELPQINKKFDDILNQIKLIAVKILKKLKVREINLKVFILQKDHRCKKLSMPTEHRILLFTMCHTVEAFQEIGLSWHQYHCHRSMVTYKNG